ncbi:hypothetical protein KR044_004075 [Drosophila immigrans]|nr:hypothetical protein KR044_004075 [Drosophila immigrans]
MKNNNWNHTISNDDVGLDLRNAFETNRKLSLTFPYEGQVGTDRYYKFEEINLYIEELAERYPSRVEVKTVGKSYEGRSLKTIRITNGDGRLNKQVIFVDGGIHAREWIAHASVLYAISELANNHQTHAELLQDYDWIILPVVNPDGYEFTHLSPDNRFWRKTRQPISDRCIGTDGNRNFDFHWNETETILDPCSITYPGPKAFSEPETMTIVVRDLMHSLADRGIMYLTLHSFGNYLLYPWGWTGDLPDTVDQLHAVASAGGDAIEAATGTVHEVGSSTNVLYIAAGASDDYTFYAGFNISITMELSGGGTTGFDPPAISIEEFVVETWIGVRAMAEKVIELF